jgi:hypothetical protein
MSRGGLFLLFLFVIPSAASESASSRSLPALSQMLCVSTDHCWRYLHFFGGMTEKREEADSLAALGMTNKKDKNNHKDKTAKATTTAKPTTNPPVRQLQPHPNCYGTVDTHALPLHWTGL